MSTPTDLMGSLARIVRVSVRVILIFFVVVLIHEGAHALMFAYFGYPVTQFVVGVGDPWVSVVVGPTEFGLTPFLLGAYVRAPEGVPRIGSGDVPGRGRMSRITCWKCQTSFRPITADEQATLAQWVFRVKKYREGHLVPLKEALRALPIEDEIRRLTEVGGEVSNDSRLRTETAQGPMFRCPSCGARSRVADPTAPA